MNALELAGWAVAITAVLALVWLARRQRILRARLERLARLHASMELAYNEAPIGMSMLDRDLRFVRINRLLAALNGFSAAEHIGRSIHELLPHLAAQADAPFREVLRTGQPLLGLVISGSLPGAPAEIRHWRENVFPLFGPAGDIQGLTIAVEEITAQTRLDDALRASEARERRRAAELEAVRLATPAAILISDDVACTRITGNPESERLLRTTPGGNPSADPSNPLPRSYREFLDGHELAAHELPMQVAAATGREVRAMPIDLVFDSGEVLHTLVTAAPLRNEQGQVTGAVGAFVDVTAIKRAEQTVVQESLRKDEFLATLAHELRNPLAAIQTGLDLLKLPQKAGDPRVRSTMERQLKHLVRLIDDLLDVSRISFGKLELKMEVVDVRTVIERALELSEPQVAAAGHRLAVEGVDGAYHVAADIVRLAQVLANLLGNAAKYTPQGGQIALRCRRDGDELVLEVADTGIGIDADKLARVFDMFAQIESGRAYRQGGLGVGLSLAQKLAQLHGGSLGVVSAGAGQGSTFTLRLPLCEAVSARAAPAGPATDAAADAGAGQRQCKRILVLDDNTDAASMLAQLLSLGGHDIRVAHSGLDAIRIAADFRPELAFLDIGLPDMSGHDVARTLRGDPGTTDAILVAVTGWGSAKDRADTRAAGFDVHLTKPIGLADLEQILPHAVPATAGS